jgi:protein phosphatase
MSITADGMGGLEGGGVASRLALQALLQCLYTSLLLATETQWQTPEFCQAAVRRAFDYAGAVLREASSGEPRLSRMATTVAMTIHVGSMVLICHAGDTRVYAYADHLELLTKDHSAAWPLVESGLIELSELRNVTTRSSLTRYLSADSTDFEVRAHDPEEQASYLIATDGFWELFSTDELDDLMRSVHHRDGAADLEAAADQLQEQARRREPEDNATFILIAPDQRGSTGTGRYPCIQEQPAFVRTDGKEQPNEV